MSRRTAKTPDQAKERFLEVLAEGATVAEAAKASGISPPHRLRPAPAAVSIPVLMHGLRPAWYGWLGLLVGLFGVLGLGSVVSTSSDLAVGLGLPMVVQFFIWVVASSVFMYRDARYPGRSALRGRESVVAS